MLCAMFYGPRQKKYATIKFNESAWEGKVRGVEEGQLLLQSSSHAAASRPVIAKCFITKF